MFGICTAAGDVVSFLAGLFACGVLFCVLIVVTRVVLWKERGERRGLLGVGRGR